MDVGHSDGHVGSGMPVRTGLPGRIAVTQSCAIVLPEFTNRQAIVGRKEVDHARLDQVVAQARRDAAARQAGYRERALKMYPWICGRCAREFTRSNLQELTVHHRNHDHDFNPPDGSNWELLCVYCHDNEHSRQLDYTGANASTAEDRVESATSNPFAGLRDLLKR